MTLYRTRIFLASALLLAGAGAYSQRRTPHKLRATSLVEVITNPAGVVGTRVIPIAILSDGRFYDASDYKSRPRPFAIEDGVVYEAQNKGVAVGYVTISSANRNDQTWVGSGSWKPVEPKKAEAKEDKPRPIDPGDDRPILHREGQSTTAPAGGSQSPSSTTGTQPAASTTTTQVPAPSTTSAPPAEDSDRPVLKRRDSGSQPEAEQQAKPGSPPPTGLPPVPAAKPPAVGPAIQTYVGVSDAESTEDRSFEFAWKPGEEEQVDEKVRKLAMEQLPRENRGITEASLKNVSIRSFDLDLSNEPVLVLTAEVPGGYLARGATGARGKFVTRYITLICRMDYNNEPRKLSVSVTDDSRLDVAPRMELIDAVDVDGDGLAELLFREYGFDQKSFIIYGIGRSTVTKVFEGASEPLYSSAQTAK